MVESPLRRKFTSPRNLRTERRLKTGLLKPARSRLPNGIPEEPGRNPASEKSTLNSSPRTSPPNAPDTVVIGIHYTPAERPERADRGKVRQHAAGVGKGHRELAGRAGYDRARSSVDGIELCEQQHGAGVDAGVAAPTALSVCRQVSGVPHV